MDFRNLHTMGSKLLAIVVLFSFVPTSVYSKVLHDGWYGQLHDAACISLNESSPSCEFAELLHKMSEKSKGTSRQFPDFGSVLERLTSLYLKGHLHDEDSLKDDVETYTNDLKRNLDYWADHRYPSDLWYVEELNMFLPSPDFEKAARQAKNKARWSVVDMQKLFEGGANTLTTARELWNTLKVTTGTDDEKQERHDYMRRRLKSLMAEEVKELLGPVNRVAKWFKTKRSTLKIQRHDTAELKLFIRQTMAALGDDVNSFMNAVDDVKGAAKVDILLDEVVDYMRASTRSVGDVEFPDGTGERRGRRITGACGGAAKGMLVGAFLGPLGSAAGGVLGAVYDRFRMDDITDGVVRNTASYFVTLLRFGCVEIAFRSLDDAYKKAKVIVIDLAPKIHEIEHRRKEEAKERERQARLARMQRTLDDERALHEEGVRIARAAAEAERRRRIAEIREGELQDQAEREANRARAVELMEAERIRRIEAEQQRLVEQGLRNELAQQLAMLEDLRRTGEITVAQYDQELRNMRARQGLLQAENDELRDRQEVLANQMLAMGNALQLMQQQITCTCSASCTRWQPTGTHGTSLAGWSAPT